MTGFKHHGRSSGKTLRTILRAILFMSKGQDVVIVTSNIDMNKWTLRKAVEILRVYGISKEDCWIVGQGTHIYLNFMNESKIHFITRNVWSDWRGQHIKADKTYTDIV